MLERLFLAISMTLLLQMLLNAHSPSVRQAASSSTIEAGYKLTWVSQK
ncbi:hypothetical protein H6G20_15880 [Desertifilum sp. FACHB-1129]|uniref:Uncharacterized protein n=1 Tax=Geitlerinema calcuttense NRMC-F 0142 TaxID=2922238 RepID=A0ABT7LWQ7_9CYAN|nr:MULTISPECIES: hypothetical protein [Cyanophyceae]MCD8485250.1 hypothetical protein [Desertifilum sp.]MDA0212621.1 hypothetical protein [Cyanobacteria bacterium FC1]MDI9638752.1 hypothetical protein [Geitlerinema splendidum]MDL5045598.1 hypothetical protein [Oscillatoria amoena NRMC-F 0135]MBD2313148.1 hypothetical protein [Desertifilum sp. FACHB-1129]